MQTLKLNADYTAIEIVPWTEAISLWWVDKADIVLGYEGSMIKSQHLSMEYPAVIRLKEYTPGSKNKINYSRSNIFVRDEFTCQYCGNEFKREELDLDHVVPKSQGGKKSFTNIVASCKPCNREKADRTPQEAGMTLLRTPFKPKFRSAIAFRACINNYPEEWSTFMN